MQRRGEPRTVRIVAIQAEGDNGDRREQRRHAVRSVCSARIITTEQKRADQFTKSRESTRDPGTNEVVSTGSAPTATMPKDNQTVRIASHLSDGTSYV